LMVWCPASTQEVSGFFLSCAVTTAWRVGLGAAPFGWTAGLVVLRAVDLVLRYGVRCAPEWG
jgi:hypothetical protein